ncbi:hypothetical protein FE783_10165 [Paenibacillus mesophilus]|uniref:hypothetical protein n=1 Tax=Paenibacillus mesophilus TaxID=2582849 RepID=UPI00110D5600|nr:hypothetical protein [Paenibacillus mesophilus]TMV49931.1 hypothetical protein FE783_10165 [Paenibacillus mesophilus]
MKKMNLAVWGPVLLLLGLCLTVAATGESGLAGAALAFTSTLTVTASLLLNLLGVNRNRNNRVMMFVLGFFFSIINMFVYMYSLIAGIAKVSFFSNGWAQLLFILALIIPTIIAFIIAVKAGMPSTKDKIKRY